MKKESHLSRNVNWAPTSMKILSAILQAAPTAVTGGGVGGHFHHY